MESPTLNVPDSTKEFAIAPEGNHLARIVSVVDMGTQEEEWQGNYKKSRKIRIAWELPGETYDYEKDGETVTKPFIVSSKFTLSKGKNARLRPILITLLGFKDGDEVNVFDLIAKTCMVTVTYKESKTSGKNYAVVGAVTLVPKGIKVPAQVTPSVMFSWDAYDKDTFDSLPKFVKEDLMKSDEFKVMFPPAVQLDYPKDDINPDDIPF